MIPLARYLTLPVLVLAILPQTPHKVLCTLVEFQDVNPYSQKPGSPRAGEAALTPRLVVPTILVFNFTWNDGPNGPNSWFIVHYI
jgi:hypothetical protein